MVTEDATDGRPWPIDPIGPPSGAPRPVPELVVVDGVDDLSSAFAGLANGDAPAAGNGSSPPPIGAPDPALDTVTDDDRTTYGRLLDRAAERGLLSPYDYEVRLGELAEATSLDQMRRIVTELPVFASPPPVPARASRPSRRSVPVVSPDAAPDPVARRPRASPWVLLVVIVAVVLASLVFFAVFAEHLVHNHDPGTVIGSAARLLSALHP